MRLDSVTIKNLLSHKDTRVAYLGDRINVTGDNGSGKTSATVDAMLWAFFGKARGATTDDLKGPWGNHMEVEVRFFLNGKDYRVTRKRGGSSDLTLENLTDRIDLSEKHISMTQERINALIGSEDGFTNTVVFKQGDALRFAQMKPGERKSLIDEMTGIEEMSQIEKIAKQRSKAAEGERQRLQTDLDRLLSAAGEVANMEVDLSSKAEAIRLLDSDIADATRELADAESLLATVQAGHIQKTRLEGEARQAEIAAIRAEQVLNGLLTKKTSHEQRLESLENGTTCDECGSALDPTHPHVAAKIEEYTRLASEASTNAETVRLDWVAKKEAKSHADLLASKADAQITQQYEQAKRLKEAGSIRLSDSTSKRSAVSAEHSKMSGQLDVLRRDLPKIPQIEADMTEQKRRIKGFDLIAEAFSKRGIPRELTRSFVAEIEKGANALLTGISPFTVRLSLEKEGVQKGGITEGTMDVWVRDNTLERKVEMLSGGEKMRVMLAVRLSTAQAMAKKHERAIKTLIIDEALDGLDTAGKDAALTMISSLTNFDRILMITHDTAVAGYFPEMIRFFKTADGSSVVL